MSWDLDLDPISVGFDLRRADMAARLPAGESLTVRYQALGGGELRTLTAPRRQVAATLRRHGYSVIDDACGSPCVELVDIVDATGRNAWDMVAETQRLPAVEDSPTHGHFRDMVLEYLAATTGLIALGVL